MSWECAAVENDCEDQGFGRISDGCATCTTGAFANGRAVHITLEKQSYNGGTWWTCPKCGSSYGAVLESQG